jgi:3-oxosteroid 1-dehydrogenase
MSEGASADVVIVGAGAAGLIAALAAAKAGAAVTVIEGAVKLGGTAAVSGGIVWAPCNDHMGNDHMGGSDSREAALAYFAALDNGDLRADVLEAFVDTAADALRFLESNSRVSFMPLGGYPDYYGDRPGAMLEGGRALDSGLFSYDALGEWKDRVATGTVYPLMLSETPLGGGNGVVAPEVIAERVAKDARGFGQALVGGMLEACLAAGVDFRLEHRLVRLCEQGGAVTGLIASTPAGELQINARRAVIVATGGFEWNGELAQTFLRGPIAFPASPPSNMGSGLTALMRAGAALGNMTSAWWCPTIATGETWPDGNPRAQPVLIERTLPGSVIVNRAGRRFCNEAVNYSAIAGAFHTFDPGSYGYPNLPAWLVFDHAYKLRWPVAGAMPGPQVPAWMETGATLAALAAKLGLPPAALEATLARFNADAEQGIDSEFGRGEADYDHFYGDRSQEGARATLGPLIEAPFYAVPLHLGVLGTNGGAKTDAFARVLGHDGQPITGLYAAGNVIACPTGSIYAGAGGTLGPALTFGYIAGRQAARANALTAA